MNFNLLKRNFKTIGLGLVLTGGVFVGFSTSVKAQVAPPPDGQAPRPPIERLAPGTNVRPKDFDTDIFRQARENGMRDGKYSGSNDRARNKMFRPDKAGAYKDGDSGYLKGSISKNDYKDAYRQGFIRGYENGYRGIEDRNEPPAPLGNEPLAERPLPPKARPGEPAPRPGDRAGRRDRRPKPPVTDGQPPIAPPTDGQAPPPARDGQVPPPVPPIPNPQN